jgi:putative oxidoreductase
LTSAPAWLCSSSNRRSALYCQPLTLKATAMHSSVTQPSPALPVRIVKQLMALFSAIPHSLLALLGRFSIAAVFWQSGQTKVEGFAIDLISGTFSIGMPRLADSTIELFTSEYNLPLISADLAARLAVFAEHVFPLLLLLGLATRFSALALLLMTLTIQLFVYPDAYPTHGTWAAVLLWLIARGPGAFALDQLIARHYR